MRSRKRLTSGGKRDRVAIAHDYLTQRGGAERVVLAMARAFPDAPIYTTVYDPETTYPEFRELDIRVTPLNRVGLFRRHHRVALPLYAPVVGRTRIDAEVVLASSSGWAHGFRTTGRMLVYCYSPARWLYHGALYLGERSSRVANLAMAVLGPPLRWWDRRAAARADRYLAISAVVQGRIRAEYGRGSTIVPAPIPDAVSQRSYTPTPADDAEPPFYLCVSRLLPYKHVDVVVAAFGDLPDERLVLVGSGPLEEELLRTATPNVTFAKDITDADLVRLYATARALIGVAHEDYGLTPLEAAIAGTPSIVLRWGGYLDTMVEDLTATFIEDVTAAAVLDGIRRFEQRTWDPEAIREHALTFTEPVFIASLHGLVDELAGSPAEDLG